MPFIIRYIIKTEAGDSKTYEVALDEKSGRLIPPPKQAAFPEWTKLNNGKCSKCTLDEKRHPHCPIAVNLENLVRDFDNALSHMKVSVFVETVDRTYGKKTDLQTALQSIFGVIMATSGCPSLDYFRPMARFHLPFATMEEHLIRSLSFHLLRELIRHKSGQPASFDLKQLIEQYEKTADVNEGFSRRIASTTHRDADRNAVVSLHSIGMIIGGELNTDLAAVEGFFK